MKKAILATKVGMTQVFSEGGELIPVTVLSAGPCVVTQIKTVENDGYDAVQVGFMDKKVKLVNKDANGRKEIIHRNGVNKPEKGHFDKAGVEPKRFVREFRFDNCADYALAQEIKADIFEAGDKVDATATSKGKGFQGVMKRWGFHGGRATHGSKFHREPGGTGECTTPGHSFKNIKLPGRMGFKRVTVQNLKIVKVDPELKVIMVRGAVPGNKDCTLIVKSAVKK